MPQEMTILQFHSRFKSDDDCLTAIVQRRWPHGFKCPHCNSANATKLSKRRAFQCNNCKKQTSITAGTIFEKTRVPLLNWFFMMFLVANDKGGASASRLSHLLDMRYDTVWHILQKLRVAMGQRDENYLLAGSIEIDEGFFGGTDKGGGRRGRASRKKYPSW